MRTGLRLLGLVLLMFVIAACNTASNGIPASDEVPLLTDADLDAAANLTMANAVESVQRDVSAKNTIDLSKTISDKSALGQVSELSQLGALSTLAAEIDTESHLAYVQKFPFGKSGFYLVRVRRPRPRAGYPNEFLLYRGNRAVDSVAVSADGDLITFIAESKEGNSEVFAYDRTGERFGKRQLVQLTNTPEDESNISMSLDGITHAWQGADSVTGAGNFTIANIDLSVPEFTTLTVNFVDAVGPLSVSEPSLSGDGSLVTFVADLGAVDLVGLFPTDGSAPATGLYTGDLSAPSLDLTGGSLMFKAKLGANDFILFDDGSALSILLSGPAYEHPYLTADALYFTYGVNGSVRTREVNTLEPATAGEDVVDKSDGDVNSAMYWAKTGFDLRYFATTFGAPSFVRPDAGGGLSDEDRTVPYHVYRFKAPITDFYEVLSIQDYDGYLNVYEGSFNPKKPEENLIAENDDFGGGYDPDNDPPGTSRVRVELKKGQRYVVVTNACGNPEAGCGPDTGKFTNVITRTDPPLPPVVLPAPDNSRFDITLVFAQDPITESLTDAQRQVFIDAAERWSTVITEDIADIPDVSLPEDFVFPGTPPVEGDIDDVIIFVRFGNLGGPLGSAGPRFIRSPGTDNEFLTTVGLMQFEIAEFGPGGFFEDEQQYQDVIVHEMGHVIGIGTLWDLTGNVDENYIGDPSQVPTVAPGLPNPDYNPGFTGAGAVAEYSVLSGLAETVVPIANTGGPGNFNGHWREIVFNNELMTPFAAGLELLSRMTAASLGDIGYVVDIDSIAVDQDYELTRVNGELEQLAPNPTVYVDGTDFFVFSGSVSGDVSAVVEAVDINLVPPRDSTSGCEAEDFASFTAGNIALLQRGTCPFVDKIANAEAAGASAVVMFNQGDSDDPARTGLFGGISNSEVIPAMAIPYALGETFANTADLELKVVVSQETGPITTAAVAPEFREEILRPIGEALPNGTLKFFK